MIHFILKSSLFLGIILLMYYSLLEKEKMHQFNRFYLVFSLLLSFTIPFVSLQNFTNNATGLHFITALNLPEILIKKSNTPIAFSFYFWVIYGLITSLFVFRFLLNLNTIRLMVLSNPKVKYNQATLVLVNQEILPFSFLNYIFLNKKDFESQNIEKELFTHELTHVNQKHSLDILFVEILKTIFWFNPLLIIFKKAIQLNHEFICDEKVLQSNSSVVHYQNLLLSKSTKFHSDYLISNLNFKITKKRLLMMAKKTEKSNIVYKKIIASVCLTLLFIVSCQKKSEPIHAINSSNNTTKTIHEPQFKGGMDAFFKFIGENYKIPIGFKGKGKVNMKFMVEKDGSLSDFIIEKETNSGIGAEAIRVLKTCPKWIPATENGKNIRVQYSLPITIQP